VDRHANPTLGFKFIKLKDIERECQLGCGKIVKNQKLEKRLAFTPIKHWRTRCTTCQSYVHPNGVDLIKGAHLVQATFLRHFTDKE
jgi:hypothetical protein